MPDKETSVETPEVETPEILDIKDDVETPKVETPEIDSLDYESLYQDEHSKYTDLETKYNELIVKHNKVVKMYNERFSGKTQENVLPTPELPEQEKEENNITIEELLFGKDE